MVGKIGMGKCGADEFANRIWQRPPLSPNTVFTTMRNIAQAGVNRVISLWQNYAPRPLQSVMANHPGKIALLTVACISSFLVISLWRKHATQPAARPLQPIVPPKVTFDYERVITESQTAHDALPEGSDLKKALVTFSEIYTFYRPVHNGIKETLDVPEVLMALSNLNRVATTEDYDIEVVEWYLAHIQRFFAVRREL